MFSRSLVRPSFVTELSVLPAAAAFCYFQLVSALACELYKYVMLINEELNLLFDLLLFLVVSPSSCIVYSLLTAHIQIDSG